MHTIETRPNRSTPFTLYFVEKSNDPLVEQRIAGEARRA